MTTKTFHIGDILSVTSGIFCTPNGMGGLYDILNWMTGDDLMTHQLPRASRECAPDLRRQHPDLAGVSVPGFSGEAEGLAWIAWQVQIFGETREVAPLTAGDRMGR
ncbi:hypothetical protein ABT369_39590 [Dactylosporangium sp. NPDC000244]|uniref:DUF7736 domain-containing protein n=1 Tax=Dactylosporangium sp. NPDC000244 TaxID=3154365 RepID=UPI003322BB21